MKWDLLYTRKCRPSNTSVSSHEVNDSLRTPYATYEGHTNSNNWQLGSDTIGTVPLMTLPRISLSSGGPSAFASSTTTRKTFSSGSQHSRRNRYLQALIASRILWPPPPNST